MDEDFNDLAADLGGDDFFDFDFETPFRSRSYTWPSRPPSFASPHVTNLEQTQLTQLRDVTENEVPLLSDIVQSCPEPPLSPGSVGGVRKVWFPYSYFKSMIGRPNLAVFVCDKIEKCYWHWKWGLLV